MANNKMLIDASHPEETRVAVVRGNRIEEFDFESQAKRQLRGNIYLAKVTRVEPSLQAAFVDYGGNRHGFLAFNEIHPDYYQIPTADRQALLEEEALAAEEDGDSDAAQLSADAETSEDENGEDGSRKKKRSKRSQTRGRRGRKSKASADDAQETDAEAADADTATSENAQAAEAQDDSAPADDAAIDETSADITASADAPSDDEGDAGSAAEPETAEAAGDPDGDTSAELVADAEPDEEDGEDDEPKGGTIAAIVETDSISEPAPPEDYPTDEPDEDGESPESDAGSGETELKESSDEAGTGEETGEETAEAAKKKPRRRTTRRKPAKAEKKSEGDDEVDAVAEDAAVAEPADAAPSDNGETGADAQVTATDEQASDEASAEADSEGETAAKEKPARARRSTRGRKRGKSDDDENGQEEPDESVESVGSEDALEEVPYRRKLRRQYKIQEVVKRRQVMLVQVVKEERGNKGAALTTYLSLAGRYSVLMPNTARGGGISRKITNANDRKRLKAIAAELDVPAGMGVILRTAGASRTKAEIKRDFEYLMRLWENVRSLTLTSNAPCLVYEEGSLIKRSIRDLYDKNTGEVLVSGDEGYREAKEFMRMLMPSHAKNVKQYEEDQSIFSRNGVEQQLDRLLSPQVTLKSGGYLVINQTEALVSIDVNSGRSTREHSIEDTALATNLEASEEIARQLRLRDLAGLIVIDFIDMEENRNNRSVEKRLKEALKSDRARIQVGRISHFGLLEMSRQRIRASVMESTMEVCPHCQGTGYVRSDSSIALHIFRAIEDHAMRHSRNNVVVRCPTDIAIDILNHKRTGLVEIEQRLGLQVQIHADAGLPGQTFSIEKGEPATGTPARVAHVQMDSAPSIDPDPEVELEAADTAIADDGDEDDDGTRKKRRRRRGKRGGRRNRSEEAETADAVAAESSNEDAGEETSANAEADQEVAQADAGETSDQAEDEAVADADAEESSAEPVTEDATAQKSEETLAETAASDEQASEQVQAEEEPAPASPRGRNTRRPRRTASKPVAADDGGDEAPGDVMVAEAPSEPASKSNEEEDNGTKRSGWWNRGGGFF